jgi:pullulanase
MTPSVNLIRASDLHLFIIEELSPTQLQSLRLRVHDQLEPLKLLEFHHSEKGFLYTFQRSRPLELGVDYLLVIEGIGAYPVDMKAAMTFDDFDHNFSYEHHDLGSHYQPQATVFKLWAPLASKVLLHLYKSPNTLLSIVPMIRGEKGVYSYTFVGDADGLYYRYDITNHGISQLTIDPYAIGSSSNGEYSVVINLAKLEMPMYDDRLTPLISYQHAIVYETHIRDFTNHPSTNLPNKGTFLAAYAQGYTTHEGKPVGFDYLKSLGITHVQLLPVQDYATVNEAAITHSYNWGYDPFQYFALEGSLASNPDDPYNRLLEFKRFVSTCHAHHIRVNIDVVFNHVYEYQHSVFEKVVPGYYFRVLPNGTMSNGSFCGNDFATEKPMVRHLILHAATYLVSTFHLDGFRFDLMGILDIETLNQLQQRLRAMNPSFMLYGEGWDMPTHLPRPLKGITENAHQLPAFAFFNDSFRNLIKGGNFTHELQDQGYATGQLQYAHLIPFLLTGSCRSDLGHPKVPDANQSLNYVECHDNHTFYDKLLVSNANEPESLRFKRIIFANALIAFAAGIPFFHRGQEFGGTKLGDHNSYRSGDRINTLDYRLMVERWSLVESFQALLYLRKQLLTLSGSRGWAYDFVQWQMLDHGTWLMYLSFQTPMVIIFNPSLYQVQMPDSIRHQPYKVIFDGERLSDQPFSLTHIPPLTCLVLKQI